MTDFKPGLVHTPVTPFTAENRIDFPVLGKLIDFHIANGAEAIAAPMHVGESVSLTDSEKRELIAAIIGHVAGRVPVIAHASDSGTAIAASLAKFAGGAGAAAIVSTTPYYWTPPPAMLVEHFAQIAAVVKVPFFVHNAPDEMSGIKVNTGMMLQLIDRAPNFAGVIDSGLDWQFMIELLTDAPKLRSGFQLISGVEYLVSARAIGATGLFSTLASIAPALVRRMYDDCANDRLFEVRAVQEDVAALRQVVKSGGVAALKAAMRAMGRDTGNPRAPLRQLSPDASARLDAGLDVIPSLQSERRGW
jgi:4-hydroxy-tetrahydrodipicolinate synthase